LLPKTKYARSDDVLIAYQVRGEGPVDVVMAPGTMSHLDLDWEIPRRALFYERFSRFCRLIRFDKRGTGLSDRPVKMATLEERADDIRAVMDAVRIERANLFGASEGSWVRILPGAPIFKGLAPRSQMLAPSARPFIHRLGSRIAPFLPRTSHSQRAASS